MPTMVGIVTLAQESRFQLTDDRGIGHLFILSHGASAEPSQLVDLQHRQTRISVRYKESTTLIANIAKRIDLCA
jgi:hypothetical protein